MTSTLRPTAKRCLWLMMLLMGSLLFAHSSAHGQEAPTTQPSNNLRIGLLTIEPGDVYWSTFGHNALLVFDAEKNDGLVYDFGIFSFEQEGFFLRFLRGNMLYLATETPMKRHLGAYKAEKRGVVLNWLNLSPQQNQAIASALAERAKPENAPYHYDYFIRNCSTEVRDLLNNHLGNLLKPTLEQRQTNHTYRSEALRLGADTWWLYRGMDLGLGTKSDQPLNAWQASFLPMHLQSALKTLTLPNGQTLLQPDQTLLPLSGRSKPETTPKRWLSSGLIGLGTALLIFLLGQHHGIRRMLLIALPTLFGVIGLGMLALWFFTHHSMAASNTLLLVCHPLWFWLAWKTLKKQPTKHLIWVCLGLSATGFALSQTPFSHQDTLRHACLFLPCMAVVWWWHQHSKTTNKPERTAH